jgi:hypothetical protein
VLWRGGSKTDAAATALSSLLDLQAETFAITNPSHGHATKKKAKKQERDAADPYAVLALKAHAQIVIEARLQKIFLQTATVKI